jgi:hypothetical protein
MPALAAQSPYSPEFREWYELAQTTNEVLKAKEVWEQANPHADSNSGPDAQLYDALKKLENAIFARPVRSQTDVDELAIIALYWTETKTVPGKDLTKLSEFTLGRDGELEGEYREERSRAHLIQGAARLVLVRV